MANYRNRLTNATLNYLERKDVEVTRVSINIPRGNSQTTTISVDRPIYDLLESDNFPGKRKEVNGSYAESSLSKFVCSEKGLSPYEEKVRIEWKKNA